MRRRNIISKRAMFALVPLHPSLGGGDDGSDGRSNSGYNGGDSRGNRASGRGDGSGGRRSNNRADSGSGGRGDGSDGRGGAKPSRGRANDTGRGPGQSGAGRVGRHGRVVSGLVDGSRERTSGVEVGTTDTLVEARDVPGRVGRSGTVLAQGDVDVLLDGRRVDIEGQVRQLGVVAENNLETGGDTVVANKSIDDGTVLGNSEELLVGGSVGTEKERGGVGVGEVDSEVFLGLVEQGDGAKGRVGRSHVHGRSHVRRNSRVAIGELSGAGENHAISINDHKSSESGDSLGGQTSDLSSSIVGTHDGLDSGVADSKPRKVLGTARQDRSSGVLDDLGGTSLGGTDVDEVIFHIGHNARVGVVENCRVKTKVSGMNRRRRGQMKRTG
jgi:hypothetical protein